MNKTNLDNLESVLERNNITRKNSGLKGYCHKIFYYRYIFFLYRLSPGLWYRTPTFNVFKNSRRYSQLKVHHRTGGKFITGVNDTGGKFTVLSSTPIVTLFSRFTLIASAAVCMCGLLKTDAASDCLLIKRHCIGTKGLPGVQLQN